MSLRIHTNVDAQTVQRYLMRVVDDMRGRQRHVASGLRIASASDDPAGLKVSDRMLARASSMDAAARNIEHALGLVRIAEAAYTELGAIATRMKELSVAAFNDVLSDTDRAVLTAEYRELLDEYERISRATEYDGTPLFESRRTIHVQVGPEKEETVTLELRELPGEPKSLRTLSFANALSARRIEQHADFALRVVVSERGRFAAAQAELESALRRARDGELESHVARGRIRDADLALETAEMTRLGIAQAVSVSAFIHAEVRPELALLLLERHQRMFEDFGTEAAEAPLARGS